MVRENCRQKVDILFSECVVALLTYNLKLNLSQAIHFHRN